MGEFTLLLQRISTKIFQIYKLFQKFLIVHRYLVTKVKIG